MGTVLGVDGANVGRVRGWVSVRLIEGRLRRIDFHPDFKHVLASADDADVIGVDIPIGHDDPDATRQGGRRACDVAAKERLGPRVASVFMTPPLDLLRLADQAAASDAAAARGSIAPSAQMWGLRDRILEVDAFVRDDARIKEVHPEVAFLSLRDTLGQDLDLGPPKTTWNGLFARLSLLHDAGLRPTRSLGGVGRAHPHDVVDATVLAWVAARIADGHARPLPDPPPTEPVTGYPVAIWS